MDSDQGHWVQSRGPNSSQRKSVVGPEDNEISSHRGSYETSHGTVTIHNLSQTLYDPIRSNLRNDVLKSPGNNTVI